MPPQAGGSARWPAHAALLAVLVGAFHWDSVFQVARADQLIYLHQTAGLSGLAEILRGTLSFTRQEGVPGDHILFRPVLYAVLGLERWIWDYRFAGWQATNVALHLAVVLALHRYLWTLLKGSGWLATLAALHFGVLRGGVEMVLWHHLAGYLAFCLLVLLAGLLARRFDEQPDPPGAVGLALVVLVAGFTVEIGNVLAWSMAVALSLAPGSRQALESPARAASRRMAVAALAAIPVVYVAISVADHAVRLGWPHSGGREFPFGLPGDTAHALGWWAWTSLVPSGMSLWAGSRLKASAMPDHSAFEVWLNAVAAFAAIAFIAWRVAGRVREGARAVRRDFLFAAMWLSLALAFAALVAFGRGSARGVQAALATNTYYAYFFWLFAVLGTAHLVGAVPPDPQARWREWRLAPLLGVLAAGIFFSVRSGLPLIAEMRYEYSAPRAALVGRIARLHAEHAGDPDFTFSVVRPCDADEELLWMKPHARSVAATYRLSNVLFPRTARETDGRHLVRCPPAAESRHAVGGTPR